MNRAFALLVCIAAFAFTSIPLAAQPKQQDLLHAKGILRKRGGLEALWGALDQAAALHPQVLG